MLLEASSEAPATWLDRLCVVSAVRVSVPAAASSCTAEAETLRDDGADRGLEIVGEANEFGAPRRACRLVLRILRGGIALGLGDRLHLELFDRAGHLAESRPCARGPAARRRNCRRRARASPCTSRSSAGEMPLPSSSASTAPSRKPPTASIMIRCSVSPMRRVGLRFEPLLIGQQIRLHRARALARSPPPNPPSRRPARRSALEFSISLVERLPVFLEQRWTASLRPAARSFRRSTRSHAASSRRTSAAPSRWWRPPGRH